MNLQNDIVSETQTAGYINNKLYKKKYVIYTSQHNYVYIFVYELT